MTEKRSFKGLMKIMTVVILAVVVLSTLTIAFGASNQTSKLVAIGTAGTLIPNNVNNTLNVTFSDMNYITQPPQYAVYRGGYNLSKTGTSFIGAKGIEITNGSDGSTYQTLYHDGATYTAANFSQVAYNFSKDKGSEAYAFSEARLAYNGTSTESYNYVLSAVGQTGLPTTSSTVVKGNAVNMTWINIAPGTGTATLNYYKVGAGTGGSAYRNATSASFTDKNGFNGKLHNLTFYLYSMYITTDKTNTYVNASISNTANGTILATASVSMAKAYLNLSTLNVTSFQASMEKQYSGFMMDWMYVATHNTYSSATAAVSPALQADSSLSPMVSGSASFVNTGSSAYAPFDPSASNNTQYNQAPNSTAVHVNTNVGSKDFTGGVIASNNSTVLHALLLNTSVAKTNFKAGNQSLNSTSGFQTIAITPQNNNVVNANIHIAVWNSTGIHNAIMGFLKNYSAIKATEDTGIVTNSTDITIMGYTIGSVQLSTNMSAGDASSVRNYFDNNMASVMKADNISLVDTNTTAIVAGAFAGDFYYAGAAYVPLVQGTTIINPLTGQSFDSLQAAGFASGAFISGGAVIVPQATILGWSDGTPIFASGFSFGSLFSTLSSAGQGVANWFGNGAHSISNGIGTAIHSGTNYVVKPISSDVSTATKNFNSFYSDIGNLSNSIVPTIGAIPGDIKTQISNGLGPIAGAVSKVSSQLGSFKQGIITSVASGYSGLKTNIYELGNSTSNSIASLKNTVGKYVAQDQAAISSLYTAMANIPGEIKTDTTSLAAGFYNASKTDMSTLLNTAGAYYTGLTGKFLNATQSAYGSISSKIVGLGNTIQSGAGSAWSMITSFGAKVGYILEIVGITIAMVVIIGLVLYFFVFKKPSVGVPGEVGL